MDSCVDLKCMILSISKLKLGSKLEFILTKNGISNLTNLAEASEESLKRIPGIGYASARKILRAYRSFIDSLSENNKPVTNSRHSKNVSVQGELKFFLHPTVSKSDLSLQDKEIVSLIVNGYSQQKVSSMAKLSNRALRHRLAELKTNYQANTIPQLVCNIFDEVHILSDVAKTS